MTVKCQNCGQGFSRSEHLTRHLRSHTKEKPHICPVCHKGFSRSDVLNRHHNSHHNAPENGSQLALPNFRACAPCVQARSKCLGFSPCQRCSLKNLDCHYPTQIEKRTRKRPRPRGGNKATPDQPDEPVATQGIPLPFWPNDTPTLSNQQRCHLDLQGPSRHLPQSPSIAETSNARLVEQAALYHPEIPQDTVQDQYFGNGDASHANFGSFQATIQFDYPMTSHQQPAEFGYSAINWLSPNDLSYDEFILDSQYIDPNTFHGTSPSSQLLNDQFAGAREGPDAIVCLTPDIDAVQQTGAIFGHSQYHNSPSASSQSQVTSSTPSKSLSYYADGANAREPRYGRLRRHRLFLGTIENIKRRFSRPNLDHEFFFPAGIEIQAVNHSFHIENVTLPHLYGRLHTEFQKLCLSNSSPFKTDNFPSSAVFDLAKHLYFEYFHPTFPLLHRSLILETESWPLELAIAAIGIGYLGTEDASRCGEALLEFLHRYLDSPGSSSCSDITSLKMRHSEELIRTQSRILCTVGMFHSRNEVFVERANSYRSKLVTLCLRRRFLQERDMAVENGQMPWQEWVLQESKLRVGYCIWWLDCIIAYQSECRPQMRLEDVKASLPCCEYIWDAPDEESWIRCDVASRDTPSLSAALEALYKRKPARRNIGEFGKILLIHGLYHRTWEVARYQRDALSDWIPSVPGTRSPSPSTSSEPRAASHWLPRNPMFSKWRNSACDCLDALHWSANSLVAQRSGLEHPTILHLHLARLILLTPISTIQNLASTLLSIFTNGSIPQDSCSAEYQSDRGEVLRWFIQDQYKARLAIVHAGAIFWHVRRYSHDSMLEPFAVLISSLVLWAYSSSYQIVSQQRHQREAREQTGSGLEREGSESLEIESKDLPFINIDRLCDDELIQMYVLKGANMTGYLAGVGDFCKKGNSPKVLREGAKLIASNGVHRVEVKGSIDPRMSYSVPTWGVSQRHVVFLKEVADAAERREI